MLSYFEEMTSPTTPSKNTVNVLSNLAPPDEPDLETTLLSPKQGTPEKSHDESHRATSSERNRPAVTSSIQAVPIALHIAAEKLRRQNERNAQSEAAIEDIMKSRGGRSSRANKWKPFDLHTDDDASSQVSDSARNTPLDVHAKVFQPTPLHAASLASYTPEDHHLEHGFQGITNRRVKSTPFPGIENNTAAGAVINKKQISEVFGGTLPSPSYCQSHPGTHNGQIQFCLHPNGDISAQQWSSAQFQWINIGQYSNVRKKTEGQLASDRLKGETEAQSLLQNTLSYFYTIAKQREAAVMGRSFSAVEIQASLAKCDSKLAGVFPALTVQLSMSNMAKIPTGPSLASRPHANNPVALPLRTAYEAHIKALQRHEAMDPTPTPAARFIDSPDALGPLMGPIFSTQQYNVPVVSPLPHCDNAAPSRRHPGVVGDNWSATQMARMSTSTPSYAESAFERSSLGAHLSYNTPIHDEISAVQRYLAANRSSRSSGRTVMHDPLKSQDTNSHTCDGEWDNQDQSASATDSVMLPRSIRDLDDIQQDSSACGEVAEMLYRTVSGHASSLMRIKDPPTPQVLEKVSRKPSRFHNPATMSDYDRELTSWFYAGVIRAERHQDFHERIMAEYRTQKQKPRLTAQPSIGVIGPSPSATKQQQTVASHRSSASSNAGTADNGEKSDPTSDDDTSRLLIPLLENLASYVQGPERQRHGYFAPFTPPPHWTVDNSMSGNDSFFDDDWVKPPERIGRDARYRGIWDGAYRRTGAGGGGGGGGAGAVGGPRRPLWGWD